MPGATTARLVVCALEMPMKLFMMPHTVPNRPTKGAVEPMVASSACALFMSRAAAASSRASREATRSLMPSRSVRSEESCNSCAAAAMKAAAMPRLLPTRAAALGERSLLADGGERNTQPAPAKNSSMLLASHTVQVTSDAKARPSITVCTTMSADKHRPGRKIARQVAHADDARRWIRRSWGNRRRCLRRLDGARRGRRRRGAVTGTGRGA